MPKNQGGKGNPASHRMSNPKTDAKFDRCWANGQKRKKARKDAADEAHKRNVALRKEGKLTPYEWSKQHKKTAHAKTNPAFSL